MKYLAAIDLSEASLLALDALRAVAGDEPGEVVLLHVVDVDLYTAGGLVPQIIEFAQNRLAQESGRLTRCGLNVTGVRVEQGDAAQTILRVAAEERADLVVMTNLGKGARTGRLFGSTAERVASVGEVPVLIDRVHVPPAEAEACCRYTDGSPLARTLIAVDLDHDPQAIFEFVARAPGVEATRTVHVVQKESEVDAARARLNRALQAAPNGTDAVAVVLVGAPAEAIISDAAEWQASAIAMHPCGHTALHRALWGSVSRKVALEAHCSVLFVPPTRG